MWHMGCGGWLSCQLLLVLSDPYLFMRWSDLRLAFLCDGFSGSTILLLPWYSVYCMFPYILFLFVVAEVCGFLVLFLFLFFLLLFLFAFGSAARHDSVGAELVGWHDSVDATLLAIGQPATASAGRCWFCLYLNSFFFCFGKLFALLLVAILFCTFYLLN